jgi:hypothetical protein
MQGPGLSPDGITVQGSGGSIKQAKPIAAGLLLFHPEVKQHLEQHPKFKHLYTQQSNANN